MSPNVQCRGTVVESSVEVGWGEGVGKKESGRERVGEGRRERPFAGEKKRNRIKGTMTENSIITILFMIIYIEISSTLYDLLLL